MTDLLDQLRAANPVDPSDLEIPAGLTARVLRPTPAGQRRARRLRTPLSILAAVAAVSLVALLLPGGRAGTPDLAARAYAETTGNGVIHWRIEQFTYSNGRETDHQRDEGWARNGVTHSVRYEVRRGEARLLDDSVTADGHSRTYIAASDDYLSSPAPTGESSDPTDPLAGGDPFAIFRSAYRSGKLRRVGPQTYAVDLPGDWTSGDAAIYQLDPATALPRSFTLRTSTMSDGKRYDNTLVIRFTTYERLSPTQADLAKLRLLPHPGAGPKDDPPAGHFAVLRGNRRPGPGAMRSIRMIAGGEKQFALDADGARAISPGHYLIPGYGYICLGVQPRGRLRLPGGPLVAEGFGTICVTVAQAVRHGVGGGTPASGITVGVPDGVKALRALERGGRSQIVPVRDNGATLPHGAYEWQFVR